MIASSGSPAILRLLESHPRIQSVTKSDETGIQFSIGAWNRRVLVGDATQELYGLVEIMDNNPLVCADALSIPSPAATLALIALAPLAQAGLIAESPAIIVNTVADEAELESALLRVGWSGGFALHSEPVELDGVLAATVMVAIPSSVEREDLFGLFDERYERSFYVRKDQGSVWDRNLVIGQPFALYRLGLAIDEPTSLLTIRVLASQDGKCGAAQGIHAMNVMCGFEESLGIN